MLKQGKLALLLVIVAALAGCKQGPGSPSGEKSGKMATLKKRAGNALASIKDFFGSAGASDMNFDDMFLADAEYGDLGEGLLATIHFDFNKSDTKAMENKKVVKCADVVKTELKGGRAVQVAVIGHACDAPGSKDGRNKTISVERAETIKKMLVSYGVPRDAIIVAGHGATEHVAVAKKKTTREDFKVDRRVEISMTTSEEDAVLVV